MNPVHAAAALLLAFLIALSANGNYRQSIASVPYCFAGKFGEAGFFQPCAELKRRYDI